MDRPESSNDDDNDEEKGSKKFENSSHPRSRSRQDNEKRESPELNRKDEFHRTTHSRGRRRSTKSGRKRSKNKNRRESMGISKKSNPLGRRPSRRLTRASINLPRKYKKENQVPDVPKRVFKALNILRHEKFLRAVSRYIKPNSKEL